MFTVQKITNGKAQYLVKWLNWDRPQDLTWEPLENLANVQDLIESYEGKQTGTKGGKDSGEGRKKEEMMTPVKR